MTLRLKRLLFYGSFLLLFILFLARSYIYLDPDFGWHLKLGDLILKHGPILTDPFSYTMAYYPFVDHEWLSNLLIAIIYNSLGFISLAVIFSLIATLSVYLVSFSKNRLLAAFIALLLSPLFISFLGVRPQVESWLLIAVLLKLFFDSKSWLKFRKFVPLIFLLWANLHGSFPIGLSLLGLFVFIKTLSLRKVDLTDITITALSLAATFINPYRFNLWHEVWMQLSDPYLHQTIDEWMPLFYNLTSGNFITYTYLAASLITATTLVFLERHKLTIFQVSLYVILLILSLFSKRHLPILLLALIPTLNLSLTYIKFHLGYRTRYITIIGLLIAFVWLCQSTFQKSYLWLEPFAYPKNAVAAIKKQTINGNIFSYYSWGGYLDWKLPEKRVYIDGRMPSWRSNQAPIKQSSWAFLDYRKLILGKLDITHEFEKYNIKLVLWPASLELENNDQVSQEFKVGSSKQSNQKPAEFIKNLKQAGFKEVYRDYTAIIYSKS